MKGMVVTLVLALSGAVFAESARGPYHDRAEEDAALKRLSPQDELRVRAWAAEHPEAARRLRGKIGRDPQAAILEQFEKLSPEEKDGLGGPSEIPAE